ncbi:excinuclease ABC subunit UvrA [uncultured Sunxiuqinia sp.]|uniref:excinuclease ABC subunit UvrA n=1 Tax=uncultured Sunxiuqinia sp. TaxID=1573825 RepID=UPI002AA65A28|nr:excinuclease ABC subunit UvrA [uncultured Sunxiuqinia sp.]
MKEIKITGARQNNLKNLTLELPKNKINVFTGVSGSGKSSLVFETIGAEAQRQINETQNSFARNRMLRFGVADVDKIEHLNVPVIINQQRLGGNARSTVGTATDIYASLRLLFSRIGTPFVGYSNIFSFNHPQGMCSHCNGLGVINSINTQVLFDKNKSLNEGAIQFPTFQPGGYRWLRYVDSGYFDNDKKLKDYTDEEWDLLLHSEEHKPKNPSKDWGKTVKYLGVLPRIERGFLNKNSKEEKRRKKDLQKIITTEVCPHCLGKRLNGKILSCKIKGKNIADCSSLPIDDLLLFIQSISSDTYQTVINELTKKLQNLVTIGLQYLTLDRVTTSLSGGESQRIKMVRHLGNSLEDLLYIFDEPSIGLHPKDLDNISQIIQQIKEKGNTVLIVEHDPDLIKLADHVVDLGPLSGVNGGEIIYEGNFQNLKNSKGKTGQYFSLQRGINQNPREIKDTIKVSSANLYNLKNVSVEIPTNLLTVVTGVAGSGKSTLISRVLPTQYPKTKIIDQSQIRGSSKSNLLTYLGLSDKIRRLFAKANNVSIKLFSSNSEGGCTNCKGLGVKKIDLAFMDDIEAPCEVCIGSGFQPKVLNYTYQDKNITEVLDLTTLEAKSFFNNKDFMEEFDLLIELGLDYLKLGQRLNTLSGGERQRLKLTKELDNEHSMIVLDEPSTGLHPSDTEKLMLILNRLVDQKNTIIVIEHNLDIISKADWIIDMGLGAGKYGGKVIFEGTVEKLLNHKKSATAEYLRKYL